MNSQHNRFVEELLNQMPQLSSGQYLNYRRELEDKLALARREEKAMRWIVAGSWGVALILYVGAVLLSLHWQKFHGSPMADRLLLVIAAAVLLVPVGALLLLGIYLFKYRRRVTAARSSVQEAALGELQRQLNELRAQLPPHAQSKSAPSP